MVSVGRGARYGRHLGSRTDVAGEPRAPRGEAALTTGRPTAGACRPEERGVDPLALDAVDARAPDEVPALSALLAARNGYIVFERYYGGQDPESPINVRSVTKSVTGTLAGAALRQELLYGLDQTVGEAIPERIPEEADPRVADITLWQWLTMTSGCSGTPTATGSDCSRRQIGSR